MLIFLLQVVGLLLLSSNAENIQQPIIKISNGKVQGKVLISRNGEKYNAFLGIPYGEAERFQIATDPKNWNGTYDATQFGAECIQFDYVKNFVIGQEKCLFLNVYSPVLPKDEKIPVMVWLHGGGFNWGSSNHYLPNYFMEEDIILVTLNYRLGVFGFLDLQDGTVPGNLGLRDQKLALEWVRKNIHAFQGDSSKVTLFGSSAGSTSVALQMLTDTSTLFQRGISQSGTALSAWLMQRNPLGNARQLATFLHCPTTSSDEIIDCMKMKSPAEIITATTQFKLGTPISDINFLFTPSVENPEVQNAFITECPEIIMKSIHLKHKIPWMVGFTRNDGLFNIGKILGRDDLIEEIMANWTSIAPWLFVYTFDTDKTQSEEISKKIKEKFFLPNGQIDVENFWQILSVLIGDRWEVSGTVKSIKLLGLKTSIFPYIFSYVGNFSYATAKFHKNEIHGVPNKNVQPAHLDELQYLFDGVYGAPVYNEENVLKAFSEKLIKLWVKFARTGIPETDSFNGWLPVVNDKSINFYEIDDGNNQKIIPLQTEFTERMQFWESIVPPNCQSYKSTTPRTEL